MTAAFRIIYSYPELGTAQACLYWPSEVRITKPNTWPELITYDMPGFSYDKDFAWISWLSWLWRLFLF